jgi:hypothetical protein
MWPAAPGLWATSVSKDVELCLHMLQRAALPGAAALHRALAAQAVRFPDLAQRAYEKGGFVRSRQSRAFSKDLQTAA